MDFLTECFMDFKGFFVSKGLANAVFQLNQLIGVVKNV